MKGQRARHYRCGKILFGGKKNKRKKEAEPIEKSFWTSAWKGIMLGSE